MGEGGLFPELSSYWQQAEDYAQNWSEWHQLAVWAIFCAMHRQARAEYLRGNSHLVKSSIDLAYVQRKFEESLLAPYSSYPRFMQRSFLRQTSV